MQNLWAQFLAWLEQSLPRLLGAAVIFAAGWWLSNLTIKLLRRAMNRSHADTGIITFICSLLRVLLKIIVCIMTLAQLGMDVTSIIATLGAAGLAIGLAVKDSMSNIASGAQIIFTHPFRAGDYLAVEGGAEGTVERIEIMFTTLRTYDNREIIIPNSKLTVSTLTNYTSMETRRVDLEYQVSYQADLAQVKAVLQKISDQHPLVLADPAPLIAVSAHKDSAIAIAVKAWCKTPDYWALFFDMQERVKLAFDAEGIHIPFPQMDVHLDPPQHPASNSGQSTNL
ncbi:MAG: mechanosensitive ion channel family protein [Clostridiales bacterium]|nr:mechanosensitive ion channel family protein [Clostridiales bacterium]